MKIFVQFHQEKIVVPCNGLFTIEDLASAALKRYRAIINEQGMFIKHLILMPSESYLYMEDPINTVLEDKDLVLVSSGINGLQVSTDIESSLTSTLTKNKDDIFISQVTSLAENDDNNSGESTDSGLTIESAIDETLPSLEQADELGFIKLEPLSLAHVEMSPSPVPPFPECKNTTPSHEKSSSDTLPIRNVDEDIITKPTTNNRRSLRKTLCAESSKLKDVSRVLQDDKAFECNICQKRFLHYSYLYRHKRIHNKIRKYKCHVCKRFFNNLNQLTDHKLLHKMRKCKQCDKSFATISLLKSHTMTAHQTAAQCDICNREFFNTGGMRRHRRSHFEFAPYDCETCNKKFTNLRVFRKHKSTHKGSTAHQQNHPCKSCDIVFNNVDELITHRKTSHPVKVPTDGKKRTLRCELCPRVFTRKSDLTRHVRRFFHTVKTQTIEFQCNICQKYLSSVSSLKRHKATHENTHQKVAPPSTPILA